MKQLLLFARLTALAVATAFAGERWELQYFHDEDDSRLFLSDLAFPSTERGLAVGSVRRNNTIKAVTLATSDGGRTWSLSDSAEPGLSLFFLNQRLGWMVSTKSVWRTEDAGVSWRKIGKLKNAFRVHFLDENRGFAVGARKALWRTADGGRKWERVAAVGDVKASEEYTVFQTIAFANDKDGLVAGFSNPPRRQPLQFPEWMDPETAERYRQWPGLTVLLETRDAGRTWTSSTSSIFGRISRVCLSPDGNGLGLIEFQDAFDWPSEVFHLNWKTGKSDRILRRKDRVITDIALFSGGPAYAVAVEPQGSLRRSPVPGKLRVLRSRNLADWEEMEVDWRASATRAAFAAAGPGHLWIATDTGMILRLAPGR